MGVKFNVADLSKAGLLDPEQMGYQDSLDIIKEETLKMQKSFVKIGWYLKHIRDQELFRADGYANIYECAEDQLGYSQSTVSRFINICEKFSRDHNSPELDERYNGFDKSQMIEMLPLNTDQLAQVTPDMTVQQIRNIKKTGRQQEEEDNEDIPGQTSIEADFPEYMPEDDPKGEALEQKVEKAKDDDTTELPIFKNNEHRKKWLADYKAWGLWYRDEHIDVNYYKFDFPDGSRLIVAEYLQRQHDFVKIPLDQAYYHLLEKNRKGYDFRFDRKYCHDADCETYLVEFLKNLQKK